MDESHDVGEGGVRVSVPVMTAALQIVGARELLTGSPGTALKDYRIRAVPSVASINGAEQHASVRLLHHSLSFEMLAAICTRSGRGTGSDVYVRRRCQRRRCTRFERRARSGASLLILESWSVIFAMEVEA